MTPEQLQDKIIQEVMDQVEGLISDRIGYAFTIGFEAGRKQMLIDQKVTKPKPVIQMTKAGLVIKQWESITAAEKALGISPGNISGCLTGKHGRHTAGGFKWKYSEI